MLKQLIPNFLTALNILSGCIGIALAFFGNLHLASFCILISSLLDFMDGQTAKWLNAQGEFGKELDSLADLVSFGVLPAVLIFIYMSNTDCSICTGSNDFQWAAYTAFFITIFSALRLAKFNIDTGQKDDFIGLPTPANAIFIASLPLVIEYGAENHTIFQLTHYLVNSFTSLLILTIVSSALLVIPLQMLSLKFKSYKIKANLIRYILILVSLIIFILYGFTAIPLIIIFYIFLSIISYIVKPILVVTDKSPEKPGKNNKN